jgi:hypothetical protein
VIRVHTPKNTHDFPAGTRFSTEEEYNNLCIWNGADLLGVFADGSWVLVEFADDNE